MRRWDGDMPGRGDVHPFGVSTPNPHELEGPDEEDVESLLRQLRAEADESDPPDGSPPSERARIVGQTKRAIVERLGAVTPAEFQSVAWARQQLAELRVGGTICPCCDQRVQEYRRKLTASMVRTLGAMLREARRRGGDLEFVDLPEIPQRSRDVTSAQYWGLIVRADDQRPGDVGSGRWRLTKVGVDFLSGWAVVSKYAHVYNGKLVDRSGPPINVYEVAPEFNLRELMEGA